jgi:hypothetical protein
MNYYYWFSSAMNYLKLINKNYFNKKLLSNISLLSTGFNNVIDNNKINFLLNCNILKGSSLWDKTKKCIIILDDLDSWYGENEIIYFKSFDNYIIKMESYLLNLSSKFNNDFYISYTHNDDKN